MVLRSVVHAISSMRLYAISLLILLSMTVSCEKEVINHCHEYTDRYTNEFGEVVEDVVTICDEFLTIHRNE